MRCVGWNDDSSSGLQRLQLGLIKFSARSCVIRSRNNRYNALVWVGVGGRRSTSPVFCEYAYIPLSVGLPAITATVTSGNGVGFHFNVSAGMIVGAAASCATATAAIAVDIRQATETAASIVRYAMASSSRVILENLPSRNIVHARRTAARRERRPSPAPERDAACSLSQPLSMPPWERRRGAATAATSPNRRTTTIRMRYRIAGLRNINLEMHRRTDPSRSA
jgi:hypothetical protein